MIFITPSLVFPSWHVYVYGLVNFKKCFNFCSSYLVYWAKTFVFVKFCLIRLGEMLVTFTIYSRQSFHLSRAHRTSLELSELQLILTLTIDSLEFYGYQSYFMPNYAMLSLILVMMLLWYDSKLSGLLIITLVSWVTHILKELWHPVTE